MTFLTQMCILAVIVFSAFGLALSGVAIGIAIGKKWFS
jgi:hypothetical protein